MSATPQKIGRYEIRRELGRGTMGVVYEAHDPLLARTVALKTVNQAFAEASDDREAFERRFRAEARIAARLSHPNIVVVHDVGRAEGTGTLYIALEHLHGDSLAEVLEDGERLPWKQVLDVGRQVADALHHAHGQGVVHRDIKPANVMLLPTGQAKLMDFGIARLEAAQLTATGQLFGTPLFMCPEQASSMRVDGRADIFSLGSVLYTLLTGCHAFAADTIPAIVYRVCHVDPPAPGSVDPALPGDVDVVIARCLAKRPDDRYPDAAHLSEDLSNVLEGRPPRHATGGLPPLPVPASTDVAVSASSAPAVDPPGAGPQPTRTLGALARPGRGRPRRLRRGLAALAAACIGAVALGLALPDLRSLPGTGVPGDGPAATSSAAAADSVPTPPEAVPEPTPEPTPPAATVVVDFRHTLRTGSLRIWMDDEAVLGAPVHGRVSKNLHLVKLRSGTLTDVLEVPPGRHDFLVDVRWDDEQRRERIAGLVHPGETYRLEIRLGRIRKNLSVKWTR